jgi:hypothetical protein
MTSEPNGPSGKADTNVQSAQQKTARYVNFMAIVNNYDRKLQRHLVRKDMVNMRRRAYMS